MGDLFVAKRGTLYIEEKLGLVRGVLLRLCGQNSGVKLWDVRSIEHWIRGEMENSFPARSTTRKIPRLSGNWISLKFFILAAEVTRL